MEVRDLETFDVWRIAPPSRREKLHGRHPAQKPLRLVRRALLACTREADLVFDPFSGSGTTAVAAKELNRSFVGAESLREVLRAGGTQDRSGRARGHFARDLWLACIRLARSLVGSAIAVRGGR